MSLILAIEPDRKQTSKVAAIVKNKLHAELVSGDTTEHAVAALGGRVPDLILTSLLLSRKDEAALAEWLRQSDEAGRHVQTLVIPVLGGSGRDAEEGGGLLSRFTRGRSAEATTDGCDPDVFAAQIREYLERAAEERRHAELLLEDQEEAAAAATAAEATGGPVLHQPIPAYEDSGYQPPAAPEPSSVPEEQLQPEAVSWSQAADSSVNNEPAYFEVEAVLPADAAPVGAAVEAEESDDDSWSEIALGDSTPTAGSSDAYALGTEEEDTSLELTSEPIDLQRFVEELSNQTPPEPPQPSHRRNDAPRPSSSRNDEVLAEFEEALETIAGDATAPARPNKPRAGAEAAAAHEPAGRASSTRPRPRKKSRKATPTPQWSTFDPERCGFTAVFAKLDRLAAETKTAKSGR